MTLFLLAGDSAAEILSDAGWTIAIGLVVVFAVLLLLTGIFKLFGTIMASLEKKEETTAPVAAPAPAVAPAAAAVDIGPSVSEAQVRNGISDEETAVIAAAVAASMPADKPYTIRKIDRAE